MTLGIVSVTRTRTVPLPTPWWAPWCKGRTTTEVTVIGTAEHDLHGPLRVRNTLHQKYIGCINLDVLDDETPVLSCSIPIQTGDEVRASFTRYPI